MSWLTIEFTSRPEPIPGAESVAILPILCNYGVIALGICRVRSNLSLVVQQQSLHAIERLRERHCFLCRNLTDDLLGLCVDDTDNRPASSLVDRKLQILCHERQDMLDLL